MLNIAAFDILKNQSYLITFRNEKAFEVLDKYKNDFQMIALAIKFDKLKQKIQLREPR